MTRNEKKWKEKEIVLASLKHEKKMNQHQYLMIYEYHQFVYKPYNEF